MGGFILLGHIGVPSLRYTGLTATDARGRALHAWPTLRAGRVLLSVDTHGARYPLRIDPLIQQGEKLKYTEGELGLGSHFGYSVALPSDGNTALIGGPNYADGSHNFFGYGAAWV